MNKHHKKPFVKNSQYFTNNHPTLRSNDEDDDDYTWFQELRDWNKRQDEYEKLNLDNQAEISDEWVDGIPSEIQKLIDWYKEH